MKQYKFCIINIISHVIEFCSDKLIQKEKLITETKWYLVPAFSVTG